MSDSMQPSKLRANAPVYFGLAAALPWAAALVFRYNWLMIPSEDHPFPGLWMVFANLSKPIAPGDGEFPYLPIAGAGIACLIFTFIGRLFLRCFELYLPRMMRWVLGFVCGIGVVGIILELLAIFHRLYAFSVWGVLFLLIVVLWRIAYRVNSKVPSNADIGQDARVFRRAMENQVLDRYQQSILRPQNGFAHLFSFIASILLATLIFLNFYHSVLFPEVYWDALILYLGYARMTFLEHGFPVKVVAQVGIGLGANYPHLFPLLGSTISTMYGSWSPYYLQFLTPLMGLATTFTIFHTVLRLTRMQNLALCAALVFQSTPLGLAYQMMASDYALVMLFAAAFCYVALLYIDTGLRGYLVVLTLITAAAAHVNYLMLSLWGLWVLTIIVAHWKWDSGTLHDSLMDVPPSDEQINIRHEPAFAHLEPRPTLRQIISMKSFWIIAVAGLAATSTWYIRNWIVTGNPVYAFFPHLLGGKHINTDVLASAFQEWRANGDGIGVIAQNIWGRDTILTKLQSTWYYFFQWENPWKVNPIFGAYALPGLLFWAWRVIRRLIIERTPPPMDESMRFGFVVAGLLLGMLAYFYLLADFYLYQIIATVPAMALLIAFWPMGTASFGARACLGALVLLTAIMPGLAHGLIGAKMGSPDLWALHHPLPTESEFYRMKFPGEAQMIENLNQQLHGQKLLTHDNRHLLYDPSIQLVHLDDWDVQPLYKITSPDERANRLLAMGIHYYLHIPMEEKHSINERLKLDELIRAGRMHLVYQTAEDVALYEITPKRGK